MVGAVQPPLSPLRGRYRLTRAVGSDSNSDDYLALDRRGDCEVLVKLIRPGALPTGDARATVMGLLAAAARFPLRDVLSVREIGLDAGRVFVVFERPIGAKLADLLATGNAERLRPAQIVLDALRCVESLAAAGVAHPGLSRNNVYLSDDGRVQIGDGGLPVLPDSAVLAATEIGSTARSSQSGRPPEIVVGCGAGQPAQVFFAATLLLELTLGRPVDPDSPGSTTPAGEASVNAFPFESTLDRLPVEIREATLRALSPSLASRQRTIAEYTTALERLVASGRGRRKLTQESGHRSWLPTRLVWWAGTATAAIFVALLGLIGPARAAIQIAVTPSAEVAAKFVEVRPVTPQFAERQSIVSNAEPRVDHWSAAAACWEADWACTIRELSALGKSQPADRTVDEKLSAAFYNQGVEFLSQGDIWSASAAFDNGLALTPNDATLQRERELTGELLNAAAMFDAGDWGSAAEQFAVYEGDPRLGWVTQATYASWTNAGLAALSSGNFALAAQACGNALRYAPGSVASGCLTAASSASARPVTPKKLVAPRAPAAPVIQTPTPPSPPVQLTPRGRGGRASVPQAVGVAATIPR